MKRGKRKALPKASCDVCGPQPGEEMSTCCPTLCHRHCPHPLPPADISGLEWHRRSLLTISAHGREWHRSHKGC